MLTGGQLVVPFRVRLLGRVSFWPRRLVRSSAESTTGEISLAFGHAMEVRLSRRLRSGVPPFTPYKACLFLVMVEVFIVLLARNCNINNILQPFPWTPEKISVYCFATNYIRDEITKDNGQTAAGIWQSRLDTKQRAGRLFCKKCSLFSFVSLWKS